MARDLSLVLRAHDNTRDLGGLPVPGTGVIRPGRVWRGAAHDRPLPALAQALPLRFFDLRRPDEVTAPGNGGGRERSQVDPAHPSALEYSANPRNSSHAFGSSPPPALPVHPWPLADPGGRHRPPERRDDDYFVETGLALLPHLGPCMADLCTTLATTTDPVFVGCRLGKDRTGIVVTVLCVLIGVAPEAIVADYTRTGDSFRRAPEMVAAYARTRGEDPAEVMRRLCPGPEVPRRILAALPDRASLMAGLGIGRELLSRTRAAVVY